jgi:Spx/MgsR family transcriptional regulator
VSLASSSLTIMTTTLYGISNCDTVKKARAHLAAAGTTCSFHDFKKQGVPEAELDRWIAVLGWERLLNRQGTTWRKLDEATRLGVADAAAARRVMLAQPSVIRRPVVEWSDGGLTVGFDPAAWSAR